MSQSIVNYHNCHTLQKSYYQQWPKFQIFQILFQTVAITEKKQRCGLEDSLVTTRICFTYPDASWVCKQARDDEDCNR